jgi:hypothetical protein
MAYTTMSMGSSGIRRKIGNNSTLRVPLGLTMFNIISDYNILFSDNQITTARSENYLIEFTY